MKQTVVILTALILALLAVTGTILVGNVKQMELLAQRDEMLAELRDTRETLTLENLRAERELEALTDTLEKVTQERDALSLQLNDAVLASQEANDAVAMQTAEREAMQETIAAMQSEMEALRQTAQPTTTPAP